MQMSQQEIFRDKIPLKTSKRWKTVLFSVATQENETLHAQGGCKHLSWHRIELVRTQSTAQYNTREMALEAISYTPYNTSNEIK